MGEFLFQYQRVHPVSWVYVSSLMMIALYFKFSRFWSVRNLDLLLLILLSPGLLLVYFGDAIERGEYALDDMKLAAKSESEIDSSVNVANPLSAEIGSTADETETGGFSEDALFPPEDEGLTVPEGDLTIVDTAPSSASQVDGTLDASGVAAVVAEERTSQSSRTDSGDPLIERIVHGGRVRQWGYHLLICSGGLLLVRLLLDPIMVRRPLLEPNLTVGGLAFLAGSLFVFLMANVINGNPSEDDLIGAKRAVDIIKGEETNVVDDSLKRHGPGYQILNLMPAITTITLVRNNDGLDRTEETQIRYAATAKTMAIISHLAIVVGLVIVGYRHFDNIRMGIGAAALYLMLPYTSQHTGRVDHVMPAALLVWAILCYRRPSLAGIFVGLAIGAVYYPLFLLPLWISFYWQRGLMRFMAGVVVTLVIMVVSLGLTSGSWEVFLSQLQQMFGLWLPHQEGLGGIWRDYSVDGVPEWDPVYRMPVLVAFVVLSMALAIWPAQKNLGTLISCSAAVMLATQFWHGFGGGLYVAWYLPLLLLTIFRPNLEDRVALAVLGVGWFPRRRAIVESVDQAA